MTRSMKARRLFPCFIAVDEVPPLVIGDADLLQPKIRLLLKFAPTIDLVTDAPLALAPPAMQRVLGSPRARSLIQNRPATAPRRRD
ncbi:MAG: hypothetical protein ACPH26_03005 [Candidatus Puniceispirillaceae bacterium]